MSLSITELQPPNGFERLVYAQDDASGLKTYIAIHSTACGPAAGGCRMWNYESQDAACEDVLRLASGMTRKNAIAGLGLGGGKSVIIGDAGTKKSKALFRAFGKVVNSLNGSYYTAEDVGTSPEDMAIVSQETQYAVGLNGGSFASGDPSPFTAEGVFECLKAGAQGVFGTDDLTARRILIQGLGHVGMELARKLHLSGADLIVSDVNSTAVDIAKTKFNATACPVDAVFDMDMDIFAPCALGSILTSESVAKLSAKLVCGAANNQLASSDVAYDLQRHNITYLPDYVVNAGGIISVACEIHKQGADYRDERLAQVVTRTRDIMELSNKTGKTTTRVAEEMVQDIVAGTCKLKDTA